MFIFNLELIMIGVHSWWQAGMLLAMAIFGALAFASATQGWLIVRNRWYELVGLLIVTFIAFQPQAVAKIIANISYHLNM